MVAVILIVKEPQSKHWQVKGPYKFAVLPRAGEYIRYGVGEEQIPHLYKVVDVYHEECFETEDDVIFAGDVLNASPSLMRQKETE